MTWLIGMFLIGLGLLCLYDGARATRFLSSFATSLSVHLIELALRLVAGVGLLLHAPQMRFGGAFNMLGWVLIISSLALLILPWRVHHRFASQAVPMATRYIGVLGASSLAIGVFVWWAMWAGP